jgi:membrane protein YqaA with SNARE-associated domain
MAMSLLLQATKSAVSGGRHGSHNPAASSHLLRWLMSLGGIGVFGVAIVDSSVIPLPLPGSTDLLLLLLTAHRGSTIKSAVWLAVCAIAGSILGGYLTWSAGRKGGEVALERYVPKKFLGKLTGWVEKHGALSIGVAVAGAVVFNNSMDLWRARSGRDRLRNRKVHEGQEDRRCRRQITCAGSCLSTLVKAGGGRRDGRFLR